MDDDLDFLGKPAEPVNKPPPAPAPVPAPAPAARPRSEPVSFYQPALALEFFRLAGRPEQFPAGDRIFVENEKPGGFFSKGASIYLLLDGEVALTLKGTPLELVLPGEIFGEMATIADIPRAATATVRKNCKVLALDEKQFVQSMQKMPEFALMLMSVMAQRMRRSLTKLAAAKISKVEAMTHKSTLDKKMLADLQRELGDPLPTTGTAGVTVVTQGAVGACMFVVTQGRVAISVDGLVIEHVGSGGVFGEMALIDCAGRFATATTETESAWLLISRSDFLTMIRSRPAFGIALLRSVSERIQHIGTMLRDNTP